ncbi:MAG TPA: DUF2507 domain-containing protein [Pseudogracilibacillus sp.]|nr:DUF2507 domain-containing protein [Pseudogracilibacillus sp.]
MQKEELPLHVIEQLSSETIGYDILKYVSLPNVFGAEKEAIMYYVGRDLARNIEMRSMDDLLYLFDKFRWGKLELIKQKKNEMTFHLMSDDIVHRLRSPLEVDFRLEAGFLAEAIQRLYERHSECTEKVNEKLYRVQFKVIFTD